MTTRGGATAAFGPHKSADPGSSPGPATTPVRAIVEGADPETWERRLREYHRLLCGECEGAIEECAAAQATIAERLRQARARAS